jgi:hypothetical protein
MYIYVVHRTQDVMYFPAFVIVHGFTDLIFNTALKVMFLNACVRRAVSGKVLLIAKLIFSSISKNQNKASLASSETKSFAPHVILHRN